MSILKKLGMSCEDASRLVSDAKERPLSMGERLRAGMHLTMCRYCARFQEQLAVLERAIEKDKRGD